MLEKLMASTLEVELSVFSFFVGCDRIGTED